MTDQWGAGDIYDRYMGRWSRPIAAAFIDWLDVATGASWLDVGCGTGALTATIRDLATPSGLAGIDPAAGFIRHAANALGDTAVLQVGDAQAIPFEPASFDATVSGLALNFFPDPHLGVSEMARVTAPGGIVGAYVWDYAEGMEMIRLFWDSATALDPNAKRLDEALRFPLCNPKALTEVFVSAGLHGVRSTALEAATAFTSFEDFWEPFLGVQGPAPTYVASLSGEQRDALAAELREQLDAGDDGSINLRARAWAVAGSV